jgi:hypothetical protein
MKALLITAAILRQIQLDLDRAVKTPLRASPSGRAEVDSRDIVYYVSTVNQGYPGDG